MTEERQQKTTRQIDGKKQKIEKTKETGGQKTGGEKNKTENEPKMMKTGEINKKNRGPITKRENT